MNNIWTKLNDSIPKYMDKLIKKYHFKIMKIGDLKTALIGENYALIVSIDRFSVDIAYLRKKKEEYVIYQCNNFFAERFDADDRINLINKDDIESIIINNLIVISNGLLNKWSNVLEGDVSWINDYKASKWYSEKKIKEKGNEIINKLFF